jgi:hypothetical protein
MKDERDTIDASWEDEDLDVLLERFNQMACLLTGDENSEAECSYCHGTVSLGEALLTAHISGMLAHIKCPKKSLDKIMKKAKPDPSFDFEGFIKAVDERLERDFQKECQGEIVVGDKNG